MTSKQLHIWTAVLQACNAVYGILSFYGKVPGVPPQVFVTIVGVIAAIQHYAASVVTPTTNAQTPDNAPPKP